MTYDETIKYYNKDLELNLTEIQKSMLQELEHTLLMKDILNDLKFKVNF